MTYSQQHLNEAIEIIQQIDAAKIEKMAELIAGIKRSEGRLFSWVLVEAPRIAHMQSMISGKSWVLNPTHLLTMYPN